MDSTMEKVYCCDNGWGSSWLPFMAGANSGNGFWGGGNGMNNPLWFLFLLFFAQRNGWGLDMNGTNPQIQALQNQIQDNQNANLVIDGIKGNAASLATLSQKLNCDFNTLNACCCDVKQALASIGGQIGLSTERTINALQMGDSNIIQAIQNCCCQTQKAIIEQGYQNQLAICGQTRELRDGQRDLGVAISQGFSQVGFQNQQDKCEIIQAITASQQKTADLLNTKWYNDQAREIQDLKSQISQFQQTDAIIARLRGNGFGCGNGCGNGIGY